jgi:predicted TIM-barrel fold metal-dependent hydrolase
MVNVLGIPHSNVTRRLPDGACDCHTHVFGPLARFPLSPARAYTPPDASIADLNRLHAHLGIARVVVVHPSPYGADNRVSLDAVQSIGTRARGVAVIDAATTDADLRVMDRAGMRGARENLETAGIVDPAQAWANVAATARRIAPLGWHLQIFARLPVIAALGDRIAQLPVPVVFDHFGRPSADLGIAQPGFDALRRLIGSGKAYVKLSASYRISSLGDHADAAPLARALIADNPERILWGTDWPHPGGAPRGTRGGTGLPISEIEAFQRIDDGAAVNRLIDWTGDDATLTRVLVTNPAQLYGF